MTPLLCTFARKQRRCTDSASARPPPPQWEQEEGGSELSVGGADRREVAAGVTASCDKPSSFGEKRGVCCRVGLESRSPPRFVYVRRGLLPATIFLRGPETSVTKAFRGVGGRRSGRPFTRGGMRTYWARVKASTYAEQLWTRFVFLPFTMTIIRDPTILRFPLLDLCLLPVYLELFTPDGVLV